MVNGTQGISYERLLYALNEMDQALAEITPGAWEANGCLVSAPDHAVIFECGERSDGKESDLLFAACVHNLYPTMSAALRALIVEKHELEKASKGPKLILN